MSDKAEDASGRCFFGVLFMGNGAESDRRARLLVERVEWGIRVLSVSQQGAEVDEDFLRGVVDDVAVAFGFGHPPRPEEAETG